MADHQEMAFKDDLRSILLAINSMMTAMQPASIIGTQSKLIRFREVAATYYLVKLWLCNVIRSS